ncbi:MAG: hypothetical protein JXB26_18265 [Candidatus Aminicenantes bacterium]|nr:hypothetical protein [Candidatus Aminicenantes bacterium]
MKKKCYSSQEIDDYIMGRMDKEKRDHFEKHFFCCPRCFGEIQKREEIFLAIKSEGQKIFREEIQGKRSYQPSPLRKLLALLTPKEWAAVCSSAVLFLMIILAGTPHIKRETPQFFLNEDTVRGETINLISPIGEQKTPPLRFEWEKLDKTVEYTVYLFDSKNTLLSSWSTKNDYLEISEKTNIMLSPGNEYHWQVKAFSTRGTLTAVSMKKQFFIR